MNVDILGAVLCFLTMIAIIPAYRKGELAGMAMPFLFMACGYFTYQAIV